MRQCCTDHGGKPKIKYTSQEVAEEAAERRRDEGEAVMVYACEEGDGWHLTSQNAPAPERPKNVMSAQEKRFYSKDNKRRNRAPMGGMFSQDLYEQMKSEAEENTLPILEKKIQPLQENFDLLHRKLGKLSRQRRLSASNREETAELAKKIEVVAKDEKEARIKLRAAKNEYARAVKRLS